MLLSLPSELAVTAAIAASNPYLKFRGQPIFSPSVSSYTEHLFYARRPSTTTNGTMPNPNPPPTPGSSSDIRGKEGAHTAPAFNLPPTAFQEPDRASTSSATPSVNGSDSSYRPVSPSSPTGMSRKRPAAQLGPVITKEDFELPPPPTRSRKIIQMKPRESDMTGHMSEVLTTSPQVIGRTSSAPQSGGKRKQNNTGNTAAGRKIARKTAHSLIERRRRSKMNEEFGVLKDMIPACKGQEMHKLAILQASIDYLRYLEQCVTDLQAQNKSPRPQPASTLVRERDQLDEDDDGDDQMDEDDEGVSSTPVTTVPGQSSSVVSLPSLSQITTTSTSSPPVMSTGNGRHYSISSTSQASYSPYFHSNQTSPAFGPQLSHVTTMPASAGPHRDAFGLGSPALKPFGSVQEVRPTAGGALELSEKGPPQSAKVRRSEHELDREATAALLMLNNDRRNWRTSREGEVGRSTTGMSVRDLLR